MPRERILSELGRVFDSHEHFGYFDGYCPSKPERTLKDLVNGAYMGASKVEASDHDALCKLLARYVGSDRFASFCLGMKAVYGEELYPLSPRVVNRLDAKVRAASTSGDHAFRILKEHMNACRVVLDVPPQVWRKWKDPLLGTTIRLDETACPFVRDFATGDYLVSNMGDTQIGTYAAIGGLDISTLDGFDSAIEKHVSTLRGDAMAIKIGTAYMRGIDYKVEENADGSMAALYKKVLQPKTRLLPCEMARWSNYVTTFLLSYAMLEGLPVQVHTGLATMEATSPLNLIPIMKCFPAVSFFLFHGGYPFHHVLPGVLDTCPNAHVDMCWLPILSQQATRSLLVELLSMGHADRIIAFGGDCQSPEGSLGALIALKEILGDVLDGLVSARKLLVADAVDIGNQLIRENGVAAFH